MTLSEAIERATEIVGYYPNGGKDAGEGYIGGLAAVLGAYPRSIALRSADPVRGIPSENRFLPTPADMVAWFERQVAPLYRDYEREKRIAKQIEEREKTKPYAPPVGRKYLSYGEFLEWAKANGSNARPIGAFEPGGYMGPEKL